MKITPVPPHPLPTISTLHLRCPSYLIARHNPERIKMPFISRPSREKYFKNKRFKKKRIKGFEKLSNLQH